MMTLGDKATAQLLRDALSQVDPLHDLDSLLHNFCSTCELWLGNPLQHLQSFVSAPGRVKPISLIRSVECWNSGGQLGCILCQMVSLASARIRESRKGQPFDVTKLFVTPTRDDFPHRITLLGLDSEMAGNEKIWEIELYATIDTQNPLPGLPLRRDLPSNFRSTECLDLINDWIRQCKDLHSNQNCQFPTQPRLPTRILDISSETPMLIQTTDQCNYYVALSHCWGATTGGMPPKTLQSNVQAQLKTGVPQESLPLSFKDAITVTKHLGYRYLWIDSLCIIQDDEKDWERECGRMAEVYGNADLVIGATSAAASSCGFLGPRPEYFEGALRIEGPQWPKQTAWTVHYRSSLPHNPWILNQEAFRPADEGPLESRAWAYQERVMARRYISFGRHEVCWECTSMLECECCSMQGCRDDMGILIVRKRFPAPRKYNLRRKIAQTLTTPLLRLAWRHNTVETYSRRELSRASDRLAAISASAAQFSKKLNDRYLAGIWSEDLRNGGLHWYTSELGTKVEYEAPSWSWASVTGEVTHFRRRKLKLNWEVSLEVLNIHYITSPENPFGCPSHASITLGGKMMHGVSLIYNPKSGFDIQLPAGTALDFFLDTELEPIHILEEGENPVTSARRKRSYTIDNLTKSDNRQDQHFEGLCCLALENSLAMILGLAALKPNQYERIGLCVLGSMGDINFWEHMEVTLI